MRIEIPYKMDSLTVEVAPEHFGAILELNEPECKCEKKSAVQIVSDAVAGTLEDFLALPGDVLVIVNDGTRPTPTRFVLEAIGAQLEKAQASFIVATGAHRAPNREEYDFIFGSWYDTFKERVYAHDARDMESMKYYGSTKRGTQLYLNKIVAQAQKVIVIGSVEPHYFAGYTGGRKGFLPGTAAYISIEQNHKLALSDDAHTLALEGNPVHEDMMEAVELIKAPVYSIMTVLDKDQEIDSVCAGSLKDSFENAIAAANAIFTVPLAEKADVVVTVARYPMDIDLYQSQKAIDNASLALKDGGTMILVSSCRDGIGGDAFYKLLSSADTPDEVMRKIDAGYKLGYHKAAKMVNVFRRATVQGYTELDDDMLRNIFITPVHDLQKALDDAIAKYGKDCKVVFMPDGSVTVPMVK
ncbi:MAG: nickel-dependent lactate racemase [Sphaerochaetaceae bacterium]|nr:nickel-dependent lactate racemase [Sphaerochaetaceae bacterium]